MNKRSAETPWIDGDVKPVHVGPYKRQWPTGEIWYSWWDGARFGIAGGSPDLASVGAFNESLEQSLPWRGLRRQARNESGH